MGRAALEEIDQDTDSIGEIDVVVPVEVIEGDLARALTRQLGRLADKEVAQEADSIGEVEASVTVTVAGTCRPPRSRPFSRALFTVVPRASA